MMLTCRVFNKTEQNNMDIGFVFVNLTEKMGATAQNEMRCDLFSSELLVPYLILTV